MNNNPYKFDNPSSSEEEQAISAAIQYVDFEDIISIEKLKGGLVNNSYLVSTTNYSIPRNLLLQKINNTIFKDIKLLMKNIDYVLNHIEKKLISTDIKGKKIVFPQIIKTLSFKKNFISLPSGYWRAFTFISNSSTLDNSLSIDQAFVVGETIALMHQILNDIPVNSISTAINNFHNTSFYLNQYNTFKEKCYIENSSVQKRVQNLDQFIDRYKIKVFDYHRICGQGLLTQQVIHGDLKINNILFDCNLQESISIIDFDTTQPGFLINDISDSLRSICNILGEETTDLESVDFNLNLFQSFIKGYSVFAKDIINEFDLIYLPHSIANITFELGLRFLTDFINDNNYFQVSYPEQNLYRAEVQFKLLSSILQKENSIHSFLQEEL